MSRHIFKNYFLENNLFARRVWIATFFVVILLFLLMMRLVYLQLIQYKMYTTLSEQNQMTLIPIDPNRGLIYDSHGILLADNVPTFSLDIFPEKNPHFKKTLAAIEKIITLTPDDLKQFDKALKQRRAAEGVPLKLNLTEAEVDHFYLDQYRFPGFHITGRLMRFYPLADTMVSVLGYVSRMNEDDLSKVDDSNYAATNYIGKLGLEKHDETLLHGQTGYQQIETNANGHIVRVLKNRAPIAGANLYLSIDSKLQKAAIDALGQEEGAVVAIEPSTGQVLAFVSHPQYNPNLFVIGITNKAFKTLQNDPKKPLDNRALRGLYASGSTIKPFIALQLLDQNIVSTQTTIYDPGWFKLANESHIFNDWKRSGHGSVNLHKALVESCDVFFYTMGLKMGIDKIHDIESRFGLGQLTGLEVDEELAGVAPSTAWKKDALNQSWYSGDTVNASIGQGYTLVTPLQMAMATATLANQGIGYQPRFVEEWQQADGQWIKPKPIPLPPIVLKDQHFWHIVINGMQGVVNEPAGTAHRVLFNSNYTVAGKTGTAQVFRPKQYGPQDSPSIPSKYRSHSWFIGFAPVEKPKIAIAVIVEHHPHQANIIARKVLDQYLLADNKAMKNHADNMIEETGPGD